MLTTFILEMNCSMITRLHLLPWMWAKTEITETGLTEHFIYLLISIIAILAIMPGPHDCCNEQWATVLDVAVLEDDAGDGKEETIHLEAAFGMKGLRHTLEAV